MATKRNGEKSLAGNSDQASGAGRPELDLSRLAFHGISMGCFAGAVMVSIEPWLPTARSGTERKFP